MKISRKKSKKKHNFLFSGEKKYTFIKYRILFNFVNC